jgi:nitronate monooxygenase
MVVDSSAADIVYTDYFSGVLGNYLRGSIVASGLDPDQLPEGDKAKMKFGSDGSAKAKAWRDIWGAGQGVGSIDAVAGTREVVERLGAEYRAAMQSLSAT